MSATQVQITGGGFQDIAGNPLAEGYLTFTLSQDTEVNGEQIAAGSIIQVPLDENGNVVTAAAQSLWPNDVLSPANTFYTVSAYTAEGQLVWGPNCQQVLSSPSPFVIGAWIPGAVNVLNPGGNITGLIEEGTNVTITGEGTGTSPYTISATGSSGGVTSFNTRTGAVALESSDVTTALTYTPVNKAGDTMTGALTLSGNPTSNLQAATKQYVDSSSGTAITSLTGDVAASGPGASAATLATVNANPGTSGSSSAVPVITSDAKGRITSVSTAALGTMANQNASGVSITGGSVNGIDVGISNICPVVVTQAVDILTANSPSNGDGYTLITPGDVAGGKYVSGSQSQLWNIANATGAGTFGSLSVGGSQTFTGSQGSTGTKLAATSGSFSSGNLTATDANGNIVDSGIAKPSSSFGTMAEQNATSVAVTGGTINATTVGATTASSVTATTLKSTSSATGSVLLAGATGAVSDCATVMGMGSGALHTAELRNTTLNSARTAFMMSANISGTQTALYEFGTGLGENATADYYVYQYSSNTTPFYIQAATGFTAIGGPTFPAPTCTLDVFGTMRCAELATSQTPTASSTASDHSIPIVVNGTTYYMRLSSTP